MIREIIRQVINLSSPVRGDALRVLKGFLSKGQRASTRSGDHTCLKRQSRPNKETYETDTL